MRHRSVDLRQQALAALGSGLSRQEVCQAFGIHRTTLRQWQLRQEEGSLCDRPRSGCPRRITPEDEAALLLQLQATPDATLDEHRQRWHQESGRVVSRATMARAILRLNWTRKKRV
jgi:transposase